MTNFIRILKGNKQSKTTTQSTTRTKATHKRKQTKRNEHHQDLQLQLQFSVCPAIKKTSVFLMMTNGRWKTKEPIVFQSIKKNKHFNIELVVGDGWIVVEEVLYCE